jgi:hypothetical protein
MHTNLPTILIQDRGVEDLGPQPQAPVLEGVEAEEGEAGRVRVPLDAEDATVFPGFIVLPDGRVFGFRFSVGFIGQSGQSMQ